ncbi:uncharacterized protein LOC132057790 [Lycium ferocissimum]|uniref:uncharacterized protein LOC132057790 n=1 Tax=Lycium ferocissimum TaxID=112874 RepID=UPI00281675CC|nr:uncharacterized protein LOC132057790 [Lycium ferocissimum]
MLKKIPALISTEQNEYLIALPSNEEVKLAVYGLNGDSISGPDGFSGHFFQVCWHIIGEDVTKMVREFFCRKELPRFITHTNLVLIPKKEVVNTFADLRPISLSTFANKIISRVLHERIVTVLPGIISNTQTGFVKGRSIVENVLLAQEIIRDINKRNKLHNVVVKLDMAKAYDMVSWIFLTKVLRQFSFSEVIVDMQTEVLARNLNSLHEDTAFKGYGMPKWSPQINHLSYADDTILFCSADPVSLKKMMKILRDYEKTSGQLVNNDKSSFNVHEKVPAALVNRIKRKTGMRKGSFLFTYLGCPVFYGRRKIVYYESLIKKAMNRVISWQNKLLSFGGRYILIAHVLQTMPVYLLSAMNPLKGVIDQLHKIFAKFFGVILQVLKASTGWLGRKCVCQSMKVVLALNHCMIYPKPFLQNSGEILELTFLYGEPSWEFHVEETVEYIQHTINPKLIQADNYKAWWMGETNGKFTVKSAWEEIRLKQDSLKAYRYIWLKGLLIKISFFLWRVWKRCIATDDNLKRMHINIVSRF